MLGEGPDGNVIDTGFCNAAQRFEGDVARGLKLCPSGVGANRCPQPFPIEIIDQDTFGTGIDDDRE